MNSKNKWRNDAKSKYSKKIIFENSSHIIRIEYQIEQEYFEINPDYPGLAYNKQISKEEVARFRKIMSSIPAEYFKGIEAITIRNRPHHLYDFDAWLEFRAYRTYITIYNFKYLEDYEVYNLLLHELGHKAEFNILKLNTSIAEISLSEAFAEAWRKENGGDKNLNLSSK